MYDLAHDYQTGMPHHPVHPPYLFGLSKAHGEFMRGTLSSAAEAITLGGHVGTHIDALCHFSKDGKLHGGIPVEQSHAGGIAHLSVDTIAPVFRRGVLLDVAGHRGVDVLPIDAAIGAGELSDVAKGIEIRKGDVVLVRTGWTRYWESPRDYIAEVRGPGPNLDGARWLSAKGIFAAGSDTIAFEFIPSQMPVHEHLLVESGIHIIEALDLEALARDRVREFLFVAMPLKIKGGTGSPIRPVAIVTADASRQ